MSDTDVLKTIELIDMTALTDTENCSDTDDESYGLDMDLFTRQQFASITVKGSPVAMARPRFVKKTGVAYIPRVQKKDLNSIKVAMANALEDKTRVLFEKNTPVYLKITFHMKRPLHHFRGARRGAGRVKEDYVDLCASHTMKDLDNMLKMVMDAGNGVLYDDDKQVVQAFVGKHYDDEGSCLGQTTISVEKYHRR